MAGSIPIRAARRILRAAGFWLRNSGKHEQWIDDEGRLISLPHKPEHGALYGFLAQSIRRIERGERPAKDRVNRNPRGA